MVKGAKFWNHLAPMVRELREPRVISARPGRRVCSNGMTCTRFRSRYRYGAAIFPGSCRVDSTVLAYRAAFPRRCRVAFVSDISCAEWLLCHFVGAVLVYRFLDQFRSSWHASRQRSDGPSQCKTESHPSWMAEAQGARWPSRLRQVVFLVVR